MSAVQGRNATAVRLLVQKGANINPADKRYGSPLFRAVMHNRQDDRLNIIEFLLARGADVNIRDPRGETPLHVAARKGEGERKVIEMLVEHGADINARNARGETPLALAQKSGQSAIADYLISKGAN